MPANGESGSLAVLIDADNTSPRYAQAIFEEIVTLGEANVRRIYGDFSGGRLAGWNEAIQALAILQHQQRSNTTGGCPNLSTLVEKSGGFEIRKDQSGAVHIHRKVGRGKASGAAKRTGA